MTECALPSGPVGQLPAGAVQGVMVPQGDGLVGGREDR